MLSSFEKPDKTNEQTKVRVVVPPKVPHDTRICIDIDQSKENEKKGKQPGNGTQEPKKKIDRDRDPRTREQTARDRDPRTLDETARDWDPRTQDEAETRAAAATAVASNKKGPEQHLRGRVPTVSPRATWSRTRSQLR